MPMPVGLIPANAHPKTIAVDLDDTLNDFGETLRGGDFKYDPSYSLPQATFDEYLQLIRNEQEEPGEFMSSAFAYCRLQIHLRCYEAARARPDGLEFMRWLKDEGWRIVICTRRDIRRAYEIPFDYLFMTRNKIAFCKLWGIAHLVDDSTFNIVHGSEHGINVYYPILSRHDSLPPHTARGFQSFVQVRQWIQE
jgi:hypothetical protein